jgi:hypothetical protein
MTNELQTIEHQNLQDKIYTIRGFAVILDRDFVQILRQFKTRGIK